MIAQTENYLQLSLTAQRKIMLALDFSKNEVSFYGITDADDNLIVEDLFLPEQTVSTCSVDIDDMSVAKWTCEMAEAGYLPRQLSRVWIHTHPSGVTPSGTDEATFNKILGLSDVAVMVIVDKAGTIGAWLQINNTIGLCEPVRCKIPVEIDWTDAADFSVKDFKEEFDAKVNTKVYGYQHIKQQVKQLPNLVNIGSAVWSKGTSYYRGRYLTPEQIAIVKKSEKQDDKKKTAAAKDKKPEGVKRGRGRPKGSKNKKTPTAVELITKTAVTAEYCDECQLLLPKALNKVVGVKCIKCEKTVGRHKKCHAVTLPPDSTTCFACQVNAGGQIGGAFGMNYEDIDATMYH
jgi:hypothetical protein